MKKLVTCLVLLAVVINTALAPGQDKGEVVVYTALDREYSEPILKAFEAKSGIMVKPVYDAESVKTVGLVNRLLAERQRPRCDVFWNNEIVRSIQLKKEGITAPYDSPAAKDIPAAMKDPDHHWTGFAARARVLLVNKKMLPDQKDWPTQVGDLADPKWKKEAAFSKPTAGSMSTHAAVIWASAGAEKAKAFWEATLTNAVLVDGNAQVRDAVVAGEVSWGITDSDDAHGAVVDGAPVAIIYPRTDPAGPGTLFFPNTLVLMKDSPNQDNGKMLIDFLLSPEVEKMLAESRSAQIPLHPGIPPPHGLPELRPEQILKVDWQKTYESLAPSASYIKERLNK
ncbi:extracellular solute-binding protein [Candidatus Sumerlaeota bacterium]|nr:extracellular solute-binding protein [Candidatus Sumerlaeota bacterium]